MKKLIVAIIGQDCAPWLKLCMESVEPIADHIIFINGKKDANEFNDGCYKYFTTYNDFAITDNPNYAETESLKHNKHIMIIREFEHDHPGAIGRARNAYLDFVKKHFDGELCLVLDADEIVDEKLIETLTKIKEGRFAYKFDVASIKMRHTINTLGTEDSTIPIHFVPKRLFKIIPELYYPETEHSTLMTTKDLSHIFIENGTIWHLGYSLDMFRLKKKYDNHKAKSEIHSQSFLRQWYLSHLLGKYPVAPINPTDLPKIVKDHFELIDDEFYFANRGLEMKHFIDIIHWKDHFKMKSMTDVGCGLAHRCFVAHTYGIDVMGLDISEWAILNSPYKDLEKEGRLDVMDIAKEIANRQMHPFLVSDLVVCYDILEHLPYDKLNIALSNIESLGTKDFIFSVPVLGDPNLEADKTHIIKETKEWWISKIQQTGLEVVPTPQHFLFPHQLIIARKR